MKYVCIGADNYIVLETILSFDRNTDTEELRVILQNEVTLRIHDPDRTHLQKIIDAMDVYAEDEYHV